jgi:hypothetical protein
MLVPWLLLLVHMYRLKRSVLLHPLKPLPLTLVWLLRTVLVDWTPPSVSQLNQQIVFNRSREKLRKSYNNKNVPNNSFTNYTLYMPLEESENINKNAEKLEGGNSEYCDDEVESNGIPRSSPRPVVMTWKQREKENTKLTTKLVQQKRKRDSIDKLKSNNSDVIVEDNHHANNNIIKDKNKDKSPAQPPDDSNLDASEEEAGRSSRSSSDRKQKRKGVLFRKSDSPQTSLTSFTKRKSLRFSGATTVSSMPPGESQVWNTILNYSILYYAILYYTIIYYYTLSYCTVMY